MAEDSDDSQKTEEPTDKRLSDAHKKGNVAQSQEIKSWGVLMAGALALMILAPALARDIRRLATFILANAHEFGTDFNSLEHGLADISLEVLLILWPLFLLLIVVALAVNYGQFGMIWATEKIQPDWSKLNILTGAKRLVSIRQMIEFIKGIAKLVVVGAVAFGVSIPFLKDLALVPDMDLVFALDRLYRLSLRLTVAAVAVLTIIAAADLFYQRFSYMQKMRMSKQEVKDEHKQREGDPQVKARIKRLRMERFAKRMFSKIPEADVVVTNPTHYAVALEYKMATMSAPRLVAKGIDHIARRIRELAEEHDVPIVENPPLARALYAAVEIDQEIPPEHYVAVAEVIGYVMRLRGKLPAA